VFVGNYNPQFSKILAFVVAVTSIFIYDMNSYVNTIEFVFIVNPSYEFIGKTDSNIILMMVFTPPLTIWKGTFLVKHSLKNGSNKYLKLIFELFKIFAIVCFENYAF